MKGNTKKNNAKSKQSNVMQRNAKQIQTDQCTTMHCKTKQRNAMPIKPSQRKAIQSNANKTKPGLYERCWETFGGA